MRFSLIRLGAALAATGLAGCAAAAGGAVPQDAGGPLADVAADTGPTGVTATGIAAPGKFVCTSASKSAAGFSWTASSAPGVDGYVVERAELSGEFAALPAVAANALTFADLTVAQYTAYRYRVRAKVGDKLGDTSGEVEIGPPPSGSQLAAPAPKTAPPPAALGFGSGVELALDGNGDPAVAYIDGDPNGDGDSADARLFFAGWSRKTRSWRAPLQISGDVLVGTASDRATALAFDRTSSAFAVAWCDHLSQNLSWALSADGGQTWQTEVIATAPINTTLSQPTLALGGGKAHVAWFKSGGHLYYATGTQSTPPSKWTAVKEAPVANGGSSLYPLAPAIAVDGAQAAALAYFSHAKAGVNYAALFWRPGDKSAMQITSDLGFAPGDGSSVPSLSLAFSGMSPRAAVTLRRTEAEGDPRVWFVGSKDGNSWAEPLALPSDGSHGGGASIRIAGNGKDTLAITYASSVPGSGTCGEPKLLRTTDTAAWTICSPDASGGAPKAGQFARVLFGGNDKLAMAWQSAAGVQVWLEP